MALQGTLETFALADVLRLLASTKKSGVLRVDTDRGHGELAVSEGLLTGGHADRAPRAESPSDLLFELLRSSDGSFVFDADAHVSDGADGQDVEEALSAAEEQLAEWAEIEAVVPSPHRLVSLHAEREDDITLTADQWSVVASIGDGCTVEALGERIGRTELDTSRVARDLILMGAVALSDEDVVESATPASPASSFDPVPAPADPPAALDPTPEPEPVQAAPFGDEPDSLLADEPNPLPPLPQREPASAVAPSDPVAPVAPLFGDAPAEATPPPPPPPPAAETSWEPAPFDSDSSSFFDDDDEDPLADDPFGPDPFRIPRLPSTDAASDGEAEEMARQLANLSPRAAQAVAAAAAASSDEERDEALAQAASDGEEPINRGLLLKFLSSVDE